MYAKLKKTRQSWKQQKKCKKNVCKKQNILKRKTYIYKFSAWTSLVRKLLLQDNEAKNEKNTENDRGKDFDMASRLT